MGVTVTCLVRAIDGLATVRSCVTAAVAPKLVDGCSTREITGCHRCVRDSRTSNPLQRHLTTTCRLYLDTRDPSSLRSLGMTTKGKGNSNGECDSGIDGSVLA
jgi:hypothetical protein